jgi:hypothetical protein
MGGTLIELVLGIYSKHIELLMPIGTDDIG